MSSGGAADDSEDLARARSGERFDARGQVKSGAAFELHCQATADSTVDDHPGFVPDTYLDGLGDGTAVLAAELCSAGVWERAGSGYRIRARDHARAQLMPEMARRWW